MKKKTEGFRVYVFFDNQWVPTWWGHDNAPKSHRISTAEELLKKNIPFLTRTKAREGLKEAKESYPEHQYKIFHGVS